MVYDANELATEVSPRVAQQARHRPRILLAEDDEAMRTLLTQALSVRGYAVEALMDGTHLVARLASAAPTACDAVVSDVRMPGVSGLQVLEGLRTCPSAPPVILITAFGDRDTHVTAQRLGAAAVLDKPFDIHLLMAELERIAPLAKGIDSRCEGEDSQ